MNAALLELGGARVEHVCTVSDRFFEKNVDGLVQAASAMADRFRSQGTLFVVGRGASASDAHHVSVEFLHPVIVGQPALPAMALDGDEAASIPLGSGDIALGITDSSAGPLANWLESAGSAGLLTIALTGGGGGGVADHVLTVDDDDPLVVQEVQESACHVLHELVHLFLKEQDRAP